MHSLAAFGGDREDTDRGVEGSGSFHALVHIKIKVGQGVCLGDDQSVAVPEHERVFEGLVIAFRDAQQHHVQVGPGIIFRRADEIAHIFQEKQVRIILAHFGDGLRRHAGIHMAHAVCVGLNGSGAKSFDTLRVHGGVNIRFDDGDPGFSPQVGDDSAKEGGLSGARCAHDIDQKPALCPELVAQSLRVGVIGSRNGFMQFNDFHFRPPVLVFSLPSVDLSVFQSVFLSVFLTVFPSASRSISQIPGRSLPKRE